MGPRYGPKIVSSCSASLARKGEEFCDLLASRLKVLDIIIPPVAYPKGAVRLMEGLTAHGTFVVCTGQVKLSTSSLEGKAFILKVAEAGELLSLPATLSGKPYEITAELLEQARINFIPRATFLLFLRVNRKLLSRWPNRSLYAVARDCEFEKDRDFQEEL